MYIPSHFDEPRVEIMHELMRSRPLATLVTMSSQGLNANHIPLHLDTSSPYGTLQGHVAKANVIWKDIDTEIEALAIFHGPDSYVSPSWYPTKQEHGKVVPTWNYAAVHAYGRLRIIEDPAWIRAQLNALTNQQEAAFPTPWKPEDAPAEYIDRMIEAIVGIEIVIDRLQGKWKISQNQPSQNRQGVIVGLQTSGSVDALEMAAWMSEKEHKF